MCSELGKFLVVALGLQKRVLGKGKHVSKDGARPWVSTEAHCGGSAMHRTSRAQASQPLGIDIEEGLDSWAQAKTSVISST
jgi:hypothetical protein